MAEIVLLIPYYNNLDKLHKSLESISGLVPVDVLIVDDGSWEKPIKNELIKKYPEISSLEMITLDKNEGLSRALNHGLNYIKSKWEHRYIARLDVGDVCYAHRFKTQLEFLEKNPEIYLLGSDAAMVDQTGTEMYIRKYPEKHEEIEKRMYIFSSFMHPAVMFRSAALNKTGLYPEIVCQDYGFFFKFIKHFKTANISEALLKYELNPGGITYDRYRKLHIEGLKVIWKNFRLKYIAYILTGSLKRIICIILGPRIMIILGTRLRLLGF